VSDYIDPGDQTDAGKRAKRGKASHEPANDFGDLFGEPPPPRQRETSAAAHRKVSPEVSRLQELVFACFEKYGAMNDEQLVALTDLASLGPSTIRTRRSELVDLSKLEATGKTRNSRGNEETVFAVLVPRPEEKAALKRSPPLYFEVPAGTEASRCKYCKRVVFWIKTPQTGSPAPIDCDVDDLECFRPDAARVKNARPGRGINHFITCPLRALVRADTQRKRGK
jgi:hypothetical protein